MQKVMKYFIEFWSPGTLFAENRIIEVESSDAYSVTWPDNAYAFIVYKREDVIDGDNVYQGERKRIGPRYYHPDSKVETLEEVKENPNATKTLLTNMECNNWEKIVWTRWGNFPQPFDPFKDLVLPRS